MKEEVIYRRSFKNHTALSQKNIVFVSCDFFAPLSVENSKIKLNRCNFSKINSTALSAENSELDIDKCNFNSNFSDDIILPQLLFTNCKVNMKNSSTREGFNSSAIEAEHSTIKISDSILMNNYGYALMFYSTNFNIINTIITENAFDEELFNNIAIINSNGEFSHTVIKNSRSYAINMQLGSKVELSNCHIENNKKGIFIDEGCYCKISNSVISKNTDEDESAQIIINNANLSINTTVIKKGFAAISASKTAGVDISKSLIYDNSKAVMLYDNSSFVANNCRFLKNPLHFDSSKIKILNSYIKGNIYLNDCGYAKLQTLKLKGKIFAENSKIYAENIERLDE